MIKITDNYISISVGMFTVKQSKSRRNNKWLEPQINNLSCGSYGIDMLRKHEADLMKVKNIVHILTNNQKYQDTENAYTLNRLEHYLRLALGEVE